MKVYKGGNVIDAHSTGLQHYLDRGWSITEPEKETRTILKPKKSSEDLKPKTKSKKG